MTEGKSKPVDDLKEGLGLLFRAAKGAARSLPTDKLEEAARDAAKEVTRALETLGEEIEKVVGKVSGTSGTSHVPCEPRDVPEGTTRAGETPTADAASSPDAAPHEHEAPRGPRVG